MEIILTEGIKDQSLENIQLKIHKLRREDIKFLITAFNILKEWVRGQWMHTSKFDQNHINLLRKLKRNYFDYKYDKVLYRMIGYRNEDLTNIMKKVQKGKLYNTTSNKAIQSWSKTRKIKNIINGQRDIDFLCKALIANKNILVDLDDLYLLIKFIRKRLRRYLNDYDNSSASNLLFKFDDMLERCLKEIDDKKNEKEVIVYLPTKKQEVEIIQVITS